MAIDRISHCFVEGRMISPDIHYQDVLRRELEKRSLVNPRYSMRAFARDLEISPSRLSEIFSGKQGLSAAVGERIAKILGLTETESRIFCDLIEKEHGRSQEKRLLANLRLQEHTLQMDFDHVPEELFLVISEWYHFAILHLLECKGISQDAKTIASKLGIPSIQAQNGIDRLLRLKVISLDSKGKYHPSKEFMATTDDIPSEAIRKFHKQILQKAMESLDLQAVGNRSVASSLFAMEKRDLPKAKEMLKRFRRRFMKEVGSGERPDSVYCLSTSLFELTKDHL